MATDDATSSSCETAASETHSLPPANVACPATWSASLDLPTPPGPATVTRPGASIAAASAGRLGVAPEERRRGLRQPGRAGRAGRPRLAERGQVGSDRLGIGIDT